MNLRLPMPLNLANSRMHWAAKHKAKTAYWHHLDLLRLGKVLPPPPAQPLPKVTLASVMTLANPMDEDNAISRHKWAIDWLVARGYLAGDTRKQLRWAGLPEQRISRKNEPCLDLTLTETPP